jgi:hypothetical protein
MSPSAPSPQLESMATGAAEEVLRRIFGDDLNGCPVRVDAVSEVIKGALMQQAEHTQLLGEIHEKGLEAILALSTPPSTASGMSPAELQSLLGERLDQIRSLASRMIEISGSAKQAPPGDFPMPHA